MKHRITARLWGKHQQKDVYLFRIENGDGSFVELTNYGASVVSIHVPDRQGKLDNVLLGFPNLESYIKDRCYLGATIGRFANRIKGAAFLLDGKSYKLDANDHENTNHGGRSGFHAKVFDFEVRDDKLVFHLQSPDGEGGFPGNLKVSITYSWNEQYELHIHYFATTDQKTIANFTNHAYFNLSAEAHSILDHQLNIEAKEMLEMGADFIPTGKIVPVAHAGFSQDKIRDKMTIRGNTMYGLNNCYVLDKKAGTPKIILLDSFSGRIMEVFTSYPGLLLYTGDYLSSSLPGHQRMHYQAFDGLSLECQYYPDSPHHTHFPSTILEVGQEYDEFIMFKFKVVE